MKRQVVSVLPSTTVLMAARQVADRHIGTLPVVDEQGTLIGVVRVQDILDIFMPDFVRLLEDIDFIHDFGVLETLLPKDIPDAARLTMRDLMQEVVSVDQTCGLLRAFAIMQKHDIRDLPVVNQAGALVGIASLVDIAAKFLANWTRSEAA